MCTFAHGEAELRTKNENSFLTTNETENNFPNINPNNNFMQQMYNPYSQMNEMNSFPNLNYNNNPNYGDFSQMYNFQNLPLHHMQNNENAMINPNNINLNSNLMGMDGSLDPNLLNFYHQQQLLNRNTQN